MIIRSRAPVRIDLAGGWTDVPPFADREGGAVVNLALTRYTYTTLRPRSDGAVRLRSADYNAAVEAAAVDQLRYDGTLDLIKAALKRLRVRRGLELRTQSDAPPGSGLGTSASMGVALLGAISTLRGERRTAHEIAALATELEIEELGIAGGKQDQLAAALGGINFMQFSADPPTAHTIHMSPGVNNEIEQRLVLCYSGQSRLSGDIIQRVQHAYVSGEAATCNALRTMRRVAVEMRDALLRGEVEAIGPLLRENWACQRDLHPSVTNAQVDRLFAVADEHGALGGKACGAGGGGCLAFFCAAEREHELRSALAAAGGETIPFGVDRDGLQTWQIDETSGRIA